MSEFPPAKHVQPSSKAREAIVFVVALAMVVVMELARRWVLPPPWIGPAGLLWLALLILAFFHRWRSGLLLLLTLPAGLAAAHAAHFLYRYHLDLPLFG